MLKLVWKLFRFFYSTHKSFSNTVPVSLLCSECHRLPVDLGVSVCLCPCLAAVLRLSPVPVDLDVSVSPCPCLAAVLRVSPVACGSGCVCVAVSLLGYCPQSVTGCLWIWVCLCGCVPVWLLFSDCHRFPVDQICADILLNICSNIVMRADLSMRVWTMFPFFFCTKQTYPCQTLFAIVR